MLNSRESWRVVIAVLALVLALPVLAQAEAADDRRDFRRGPDAPPPGARRGQGPGQFIERHGDELGLEPETREAIQAIADESRLRAERLHAEIRDEHAVMRGLLSQSSPDEAGVMSQSGRIEALHAQQRKNRLEAMLAIRKLLTPEQRERLVEMREGGRWGRGRELGRGRGFVDDGGPDRGGRPWKRRRGPMARCREDIANLCPGAETGRERLQCLSAGWDDLSQDCRAAFEGRGERGSRPGRRLDSPPE